MRLSNFNNGFTARQRRADFERQVEAQVPALMRTARGFVSQQSDAEDLVHDACVKALGSFGTVSFDSEASFQAWMKRILVNTYRDQYRRSRRSPLQHSEYHATSDDSANIVELVANTEQTPLQSIENRNSSSAIQNAISMLPPEVRVVSVLFLISEFSYKDIAYITDCPMGTVMSRLARGRQLLREQLADYDPREGLSLETGKEVAKHDRL